MSVFRARLIFVLTAMGLVFALIIGRLFEVQVLHGDRYAAQSSKQTKHRAVILARRGAILDRMGNVLAQSIAADEQSEATPASAGTLYSAGTRNRLRRLYPHGAVASSLLGYVGTDGYGLGGAEYAFDQQLRGQNGWRIMQKDGINNRYARIDMPQKQPVDGADVYLTINLHIQKIVEHVLRQTISEFGAQGGLCIVLDPTNGDVLAMANEPSFDPNRLSEFGLDKRMNQCISYNYEPGSTFKVVTAAAALEEKLLSMEDTLDGNGGVYEIYDQSIRDHRPYGELSFSEAMYYSSNVCFAKIADRLGNDMLYRYTRDFGLGEKSSLLLPGEENGIVHPVERWSGRTRVTMAIGQEISVTLLQMALVFGSVANGGVLISPRIATGFVDVEGRRHTLDKSQIVRRVISSRTAQALTRMLTGVVENGTGRKAAVPGVSVAGKTGTSQKIDEDSGEYSSDRVWASFIGFTPAEKPVLVCGVVIDEPADGEVGGIAAAPAFRKIISQIISHPELHYAERMLRPDRGGTDSAGTLIRRLPDVCGMDRARAIEFLRRENIEFEIIGTGPLVRHQSPEAGRQYSARPRLLLYAQSAQDRTGVRVPNCVGKDIRDAVNAVNIKGLKPYVLGAGTVHRQYPSAGIVVQSSEICTLFCSFDG